MKSEEYLSEIRKNAGLVRAVLRRIVVEGKTVTFYLATDVRYSPEDEEAATVISQKYVDPSLTARAVISKSVPDESSVRKAVCAILKMRFPAAAAYISPEDVAVVCDRTGGRYTLSVSKGEEALFKSYAILDTLTRLLEKDFCGAWFGSLANIEREEEQLTTSLIPQAEFVIGPRLHPIAHYSAIDGAKPERAIYVADLKEEQKGVTVCGKVAFLQEKMTSGGKPYFSFTVSDVTGTQFRCNYFSKKATLEKVRSIKTGDSVLLTGDYEPYNGGLSFAAKAVDLGTPPDGYVPEERTSRPVPAYYKTVFPEPVSDLRQAAMFTDDALPKELTDNTFVVFDLETTGLNNSPSAGSMDRIIEVGAVKIVGGKICEKFSSFVSCPVALPKQIVSLTGITDDMLVGAPPVSDVVADFFRFTDGCLLVGQNVQFDYKFMRYYGEQEGYLFDKQTFDTITYAQELLHLSNYKLNTIADHFGFTFNHHRAFDDAFVTAKIFIELVKMRGKIY